MRLPIKAVKLFALKYGYSHVVIYAYDTQNNMAHVATYGRTITESDQAAQFGDMMKDALGWPESLHAVPNRVKVLQDRIKELEQALRSYEITDAGPAEEHKRSRRRR